MSSLKQGKAIWRMEAPCKGCPFSKTPAGKRQWKALTPAFRNELKRSLMNNGHFTCHETSDECGNGTNLVCAGAIAWQDERGVSGNYVRICQRLDAMGKGRKP